MVKAAVKSVILWALAGLCVWALHVVAEVWLVRRGLLTDINVPRPAFDTLLSALLFVAGFAALGLVRALRLGRRRKLDELLRQSERQHRWLFENMAQGALCHDAEGRIVSANPAACRILGRSAEHAQSPAGGGHWQAIRQDGSEFPLAEHPSMVALRTGREVKNVVMGIFNPVETGHRWVSVSAVPQFESGQDKPSRVYTTFDDITSRRQAEESLRQEHDFVTNLVETAQAIVLVLDGQGRVARLNRFGQQLLGCREDEVRGQDWFETFIPPDERQELHEVLAGVLAAPAGQTTARENVVLVRGGGQRLIRWYSSPLRDARGQVIGVLAIGNDITEIRQTEQHLRQAAKMEALGRLAGGIAHDFNNMLAIIQGYAELLGKSLGDDRQKLEDVGKIRDAVGRAAALTRQLLAFGRRQLTQPRVLQLNQVVAATQAMLQRVLGEDVELTTRLEPDLWPVRADPAQLEQVILNLALNAREAMPKGGKLTLETTNVLLDQQHARAHAGATAGQHVLLTVSDTGVGMTEEVKAHLFEPFFTTKPNGRGTGLGLATAYGIVQQAGGHIGLTSQPGRGTAFRIYLPRADAAGRVNSKCVVPSA